MGIYSIKPKFQKILEPLTSSLIKNKVHPDVLNWLGLLSSLMAGIFLYYSEDTIKLLILIPFLLLIRTTLNALDGQVSRGQNIASAYGEVQNELFDRIADSAIFIGISFSNERFTPLGLISIVFVLINSYLSILSKAAGGSRQYGGPMGKADRMLLIGLFSILIYVTKNSNLWTYCLYLILIGIVFTFFTRLKATSRELRRNSN